MASRRQLENEDVKVLAEILAKKIKDDVKTASVEALAPLFRVAERLGNLLKRNEQPRPARKPRAPRSTTSEKVTE